MKQTEISQTAFNSFTKTPWVPESQLRV